MGKIKKAFKLLLTVGIPLAAVGTPIAVVAAMKSNESAVVESIKNMYGDRYKYFLKTNSGKPLKFDILDHTLDVVFDKGFNEEAKKNATYALTGLDEILTNTDIKIYEDGNLPNHKNYIYLKLVDQDSLDGGKAAGITHLEFDQTSAELTYPVNIELDRHYIDGYWSSFEEEVPTNSMFTTVVQHEVGHALGLVDLYEKDIAKNSVMASNLGFGTQNYSNVDKENLQFVYCGENEAVSYKATYPQEVEMYDCRTQYALDALSSENKAEF